MESSNPPAAQSTNEQSTSIDQNAALCTGGGINAAPSSSAAGTATAAPPPQSADQEKLKLILLQLLLLLHADKCRKKENQTSGEGKPCSLPNCSTMKHVLSHMTTCQAGKTCTVPHCTSSNQIISHWKNCTQNDCPVCMTLYKAVGLRRQQAATGQTSQPNQGPAPANIQSTFAALGLQFITGSDILNLNTMIPRDQTLTGPPH
ncbi:CREB-binding protein [Trichonephila inaurata madagascariensis]|uniref:histone acetyltransferase n=1 Tax=Trichonephila inaurata madagascariensis TaxID=2747483 RepID=A0A8X6XTX5_9ARAC|nr:CREB-binding protein [Trichonephila inaurata madagascariensis]